MDNLQSHILVLVPNWLGDVAMCTPALRALYRRYGPLTAAGVPAACALLNGLPWFRGFVSLPPRAPVSVLFRTALQLRPHAGDMAVVFPHSFRAALLARLTGARRRAGYACNGRSWLFTEALDFPRNEAGKKKIRYTAEEYLQLATAVLGCEDDRRGLELYADPGGIAQIRALFHDGRPRIGIAPGAAFGPSKRWPVERFAAVADALSETWNAECLLLTGPGEETLEQQFLAAARHPVIRLEGQGSVERLKAAIAQLDLLVANDSGPRHLAIAFHVPVICVMGPTSPLYTAGPYEQGRVLRVDVDCGPCQKRICETDHRCMTGISPQDVIRAAETILAPAPPSS